MKKRANSMRLSPASTFKIVNSIIAIEENIIKDQYEIIKVGWKKEFFCVLESGPEFKDSVSKVLVFGFIREIAKSIGNSNYLKYLERSLMYGNHLVGRASSDFLARGGW
jgi:beta-lactamase class D